LISTSREGYLPALGERGKGVRILGSGEYKFLPRIVVGEAEKRGGRETGEEPSTKPFPWEKYSSHLVGMEGTS